MSQWFYSKNGQQLGPVDEAQLRQMFAQGMLIPSELIWTEGMAQWEAASTVFPDLHSPFPPTTPSNVFPYAGPAVPDDSSSQKTLAILAIVFGVIGIACCPILFGVGGIVCGAVAVKKNGRHRDLAKVGLIIAIVGTVAGMIIGAVVAINNMK